MSLEEEDFRGHLDWQLWRKMFTFGRPYKPQLLLLAIAAILIAALDTALPLLTKTIIDLVTQQGDVSQLRTVGLVYIAVVVAFVAGIWAFIMLAGYIQTNVSHDIRRRAFDKLQTLPFTYFDRRAVGWLMARLTSDCGQLSRVLGWALLDICWGVSVVTAVTVVMFIYSWQLALVVLAIVPPLALICRYFSLKLLLTSRQLRKANSITTAAYNEAIVGVRTTKSLGREGRNLEEFGELTGNMYTHAVRNMLYSALFVPLVVCICTTAVALALWRGGVDVSATGMSLGTLVMFIQFASFLQHPTQELANTLAVIQGAQASAERIQGLFDEDPKIQDSSEVLARLTPAPAASHLAIDGMPHRIESLEFRNVTFSYEGGQTVLSDFSLTVNAGQTIALVGPTGGGKTTIVGLACRFYEPTTGQVLINGTDYRQRSLSWLQSQLGMVLQQPHLFSGTIRANIRYGRLSATDAEVEQAARLTGAHEFITAFATGYDTTVGEGGARLSTGQKQLIALARAVLADPQIFVMDEATSSVDTATEKAIQTAIETALRGRISFVIAHRLSTIKTADRILVISAGKIIEDGSHHDLLALRGKYYELYTSQFTHEHEEQLLADDRASAEIMPANPQL
jgi:ATP-binding cassette subfamily B protein